MAPFSFASLSRLMLSVSLALCSVACQPPDSESPQPITPTLPESQTQSQSQSQSQSQGTVKVQIAHQVPSTFQTRGLNLNQVSYVKAELTGPGIDTPLKPTGADAQGLVALANATQTELAFSQVPYGPARQISLHFYNAQKQAIAGAEVQGVLHVFAAAAEGEVSFRTSPTAQIVAHLWPQISGNAQATTLNLQALQAAVDQWTGWTNNPTYQYTTHPTRLNTQAIADALVQANFDTEALNFEPGFVQASSSASGTIEGLAFGDVARLVIEDPASSPLETATNGAFGFSNIPTGTWRFVPGWKDSELSGPIQDAQNSPYGTPSFSFTAGQNQDLGTLRYQYPQPVLTSVTPSQNPGHKTLSVTGTQFHSRALAHQVLIDGQVVRVARIKTGAGQLRIALPPGLSAGSHQLQLQVGSAVSSPMNFVLDQAEPDRYMVFVARVGNYRRVHRIKTDGTGLQQLTTALAGQETQPALSPDGTRVIYRYSTCSCSGAFRVADILSEPNENPTELIAAQGQRYEYLPQWSFDGSKIVFQSNRAGGSVPQIYTMNANGTQIERVNQSNADSTAPTWSPEGNIVFSASHNTSEVDLQQITPTGTNLQFLTETTGTNAARERAPRYSPDLTQLAYTVDDPNVASRYHAYVKDLSTGQTRLVSDDIKNPVVAWQDNDTLVFERFTSAGIHRIKTDGSGLSAFPGLPSDAEYPAF